MTTNGTRLRAEFAPESEFEVAPTYRRAALEREFARLREGVLAEELSETGSVRLHRRLKQTANEAAGISWTTGFPLLVFPALFNELARRERTREARQRRILARSEMLLHESVL